MKHEITAHEARVRLGELLDQVRYSKEPCVILRHGKPTAVLVDYGSYQGNHAQSNDVPARYTAWISELTRDIAAQYRPERIILFGSVARRQVRAGSDIDLCIVKRTSKRRLDRIDDVYQCIDPAIPVDVVVLTPGEWAMRERDGDDFVRMIAAEGTVLYERRKPKGQ